MGRYIASVSELFIQSDRDNHIEHVYYVCVFVRVRCQIRVERGIHSVGLLGVRGE